jgi:hypothetical protein
MADPAWVHTQIELMPGYTRHIDPVLFSNVNSDGVLPKRTYLVSFQDNRVDQTPPSIPQAITIQRSDNGGRTWNPAREVVKNETAGFYLDKPDMVVSWHAGPTRGFIYVAYMRLDGGLFAPPYNQELYVTRSEDGGTMWSAPVRVRTGRIHAPQIAVAVNNPRVYLSWVNQDQDRIEFAFSDDNGATWSATEVAATGPMKIGENRHLDFTDSGVTVPQMRFDQVNNQVIIVWHEAEYEVRGTHTGINPDSSTLIDSTKNFVQLGVKVNDYVRNTSSSDGWDQYPNDTRWLVTGVTPTELTLSPPKNWRGPAFDQQDFDPGEPYVLKARKTDIFLTRKTITGWSAKVRLDVPLLHDQFQPSVDFGSNGNLLIGYLDRSDDVTNPNRFYRARWINTTPDGTKISAGLVANWFDSDPQLNGTDTGFIGDYTDTWFWPYTFSHGPHWHFLFSGRKQPPANNGEIWISGIAQ